MLLIGAYLVPGLDFMSFVKAYGHDFIVLTLYNPLKAVCITMATVRQEFFFFKVRSLK